MTDQEAEEFAHRHTTLQMRTAMLLIYNNHCAICGGHRALSCHHWWYPFKTCKDFSCSVALVNIVVVCRACHNALHATTLDKARMKVLPYVAAKLRTSMSDVRTILEGHCSRRHVLDSLLSSL